MNELQHENGASEFASGLQSLARLTFTSTRRFVWLSTLAIACASFSSGRLGAQGTIAGIALDEETGTAMPCIDLSLVRNDGEVVAHARTLSDGAFGLPSPEAGVYRLRFKMWGAHLLFTPDDTLAPDTDRETVHRLGFRIAVNEKGITRCSDSTHFPWCRR